MSGTIASLERAEPSNVRPLAVVLSLVIAVTVVFPSRSAGAAPGDWPWGEPAHAQRLPLTVTPSVDGGRVFARASVDFTTAFQQAGVIGAVFDPASIVVHEVDSTGAVLDDAVAFQFDPGPDYDPAGPASGELLLEVMGPTVAGVARRYAVYFETVEAGVAGTSVPEQITVDTATSDEGVGAWSIATSAATWSYQPQAGGFSSLVDPGGLDWIGWNSSSGSAGEYRGVPNLVHPEGYFHPGALGHTTTLISNGPLRASWSTVSPDGLWQLAWSVYPTHAEVEVERDDGSYWFLYEGTPGGAVDLNSDFWAQSTGATGSLADTFGGDIADPEWVQFGDPTADRSLFVANLADDASIDSYRPLNGQMTVFGFGRSGNNPVMAGADRSFAIGLLDTADRPTAADAITSLTAAPAVVVGPGQTSTPDVTPPTITVGPTTVIGSTEIEVSFTTDELTMSDLSVGSTPALELGTTTSTAYSLTHDLSVTGLDCDTTYYWGSTSADWSGNSVGTSPSEFRTAGCAEGAVRVGDELVLYEFAAGGGSVVADSSGVGPGLDLVIGDPAAVSWGVEGLSVSGATLASSGPASKLIDAVSVSGELTMEAWVRPSSVTQGGPARIVSLDGGPRSVNAMLGQGAWGSLPDDTFASRVRTSSSLSGTPTLFTPPGSATTELTHVVLTRDAAGVMSLYLDGESVATSVLSGGTQGWDPGFPLSVANTSDGSRPWNGTLCLVAVYDVALAAGDVAVNHTAGCPVGPAANRAPMIDPVGDQVSAVDTTVSLQTSASDADGDVLGFAAEGLADGLAIDAVTGEISGTPTTTGGSQVTVTVTDGNDGTDSTTFQWDIVEPSDPPLVVDDAFLGEEDTLLSVLVGSGVLVNDSDPDSDPITAVLVDDVTSGSLELSPDGSFDYTPAENFAGLDTFTYRADDGTNQSALATVTLTVEAVDDPPIAVADGYSTRPDTRLDVDAQSGVLGNDSDADLDELEAVLEADVSSGVLALAADGSFVFTPDPGFVGSDGFTYRARAGGKLSDAVDVTIAVTVTNEPPRITTGRVAFSKQVIDDTVGEAHATAAADFDGDGLLDIVAADYSGGTVNLYENDGAGGFAARLIDDRLVGAYPIGVADVNQDGHVDVLAAGYDSDTFVWYENDGTGAFTRSIIDSAADGAHSIVTADLDDDGDLDLLAANQDSGSVTWYENDGSENFSLHVIDGAAPGAKRAAAGDFNGDGRMDVVAASFFDDTVAWHESDGAGGFVERAIDESADGAYYASVGDFDGDGDADVLAASRLDSTIAWHENDGTGAFSKHLIDSGAKGARTAIPYDVDGDGDLDAIGASVDADAFSWYENDGAGNFTTGVVDAFADGAYGAFSIDFDGDGRADVLTASRDANAVALHLQIREIPLTVGLGDLATIDTSVLSVEDADTNPAALVFTLQVEPQHGSVLVAGSELTAGGTFTQSAVDGGLVTYAHDGSSAAPDRFELTLTDGGTGDSATAARVSVGVVDPNALLVHLTLDEGAGSTAADSSGFGNDGTLSGGAAFEVDTPDGSASAVRLDGSNDLIQLPTVDATGTGLTLATWFKADDFGVADARLISKASDIDNDAHVFMLGTYGIDGSAMLRARVRVGGSTVTAIAPAGQLVAGTWHHAAATHDGELLRVFLDGREVGGAVYGGDVDVDAALPIAVGAQPPGAGGRHFDGLVDDVRIYERPLADAEIAALASRP